MKMRYLFATALTGLFATLAAGPSTAQTLDEIIEGARNEGALTIGDSTNSRSMAEVIAAFTETYPFLTVDHLSEGGADMPNRVSQEVRANVPASVDVFAVGFPEGMRLGAEGALQSVNWTDLGLSPDVIGNERQVVGAAVITAFAYNTNLMSAEEAPKTWEDLLKPELTGRVVVPIDGWNTVAADLVEVWGEEKVNEYTEALKAQAVTVARSPEVVPRIASGEFPVGISRLQFVKVQQDRGAPVDAAIPDPSPSTIISWQIPVNATNSNAAKLWVAWVMSEEGHKAYEKAAGRGNPSIPGTVAAADAATANLVSYDGDPATRERRTELERTYQQMMQPN